MKIITVVEIILLTVVILLGTYMKVTTHYEYKWIHEWLGTLVGGMSFISILLAFRQRQSAVVKKLAIAVFVLIGLASVGGHLIEYTANFWITYGLMESAGVLALVASVVQLRKITV